MASENIVENFSPRGHREAVELGDRSTQLKILIPLLPHIYPAVIVLE